MRSITQGRAQIIGIVSEHIPASLVSQAASTDRLLGAGNLLASLKSRESLFIFIMVDNLGALRTKKDWLEKARLNHGA